MPGTKVKAITKNILRRLWINVRKRAERSSHLEERERKIKIIILGEGIRQRKGQRTSMREYQGHALNYLMNFANILYYCTCTV